jgi:hypothetical protein
MRPKAWINKSLLLFRLVLIAFICLRASAYCLPSQRFQWPTRSLSLIGPYNMQHASRFGASNWRINKLRLLNQLRPACSLFPPLFPSSKNHATINAFTMISGPTLFVAISDENHTSHSMAVRDHLRKVFGFSWTALRAAWRTATGISLSALYASTRAATGAWLREPTRWVLSLLPSGARYFIQPFLIVYYVPLYLIRSNTDPKLRQLRLDQRVAAAHECFGASDATPADGGSEIFADSYWGSGDSN